MHKILLAIDSYSDLTQLESTLKKMGFDTVGMQSPAAFSEKMMTFSPDVVVMTARGVKINGVQLSQRIKKRKGSPRIILLFPTNYEPTPADFKANLDLILELPIEPLRFLQQLASLLALDWASLHEKYLKMQASESSDSHSSSGSVGSVDSSLHEPPANLITLLHDTRHPQNITRVKRFEDAIKDVKITVSGGLDSRTVQQFIKNQRSNPGFENSDEESDELRRQFVKTLFNQRKRSG